MSRAEGPRSQLVVHTVSLELHTGQAFPGLLFQAAGGLGVRTWDSSPRWGGGLGHATPSSVQSPFGSPGLSLSLCCENRKPGVGTRVRDAEGTEEEGPCFRAPRGVVFRTVASRPHPGEGEGPQAAQHPLHCLGKPRTPPRRPREQLLTALTSGNKGCPHSPRTCLVPRHKSKFMVTHS